MPDRRADPSCCSCPTARGDLSVSHAAVPCGVRPRYRPLPGRAVLPHIPPCRPPETPSSSLRSHRPAVMALLGGYCEANSSMAQAWVRQGFQPCFFFTLVPTVLLSVCLLLGALQYACYVRFGRAMEPKYIPRSRLYRAQVLLSLLLALLPLGGLLWQLGGPGRLYGYMVLYACLWAAAWGCAVALLQLEHTRVLAHDRTRGHGTVLLLFWALAFAAENLTLVCWRSPLWWWALQDTDQKVSGLRGW